MADAAAGIDRHGYGVVSTHDMRQAQSLNMSRSERLPGSDSAPPGSIGALTRSITSQLGALRIIT
jgi:hypothetical protein